MEISETEFPQALGTVARRELAAHGVARYAQLSERTAQELLALHGVGPKAVRILRAELAARRLSFRDE